MAHILQNQVPGRLILYKMSHLYFAFIIAYMKRLSIAIKIVLKIKDRSKNIFVCYTMKMEILDFILCTIQIHVTCQ